LPVRGAALAARDTPDRFGLGGIALRPRTGAADARLVLRVVLDAVLRTVLRELDLAMRSQMSCARRPMIAARREVLRHRII
jgi:hypothetical protein